MPEAERVAAAARLVLAGAVVVYPTETVYGLGADTSSEAALERLIELKGREAGKPISVLIDRTEQLQALVVDVTPLAAALMRSFWPGPLTIVFAARSAVSQLLTGSTGSIGLRISSHPVAAALVRAVNRPLTTPSANPAGLPPPTRLIQAQAYFGARVGAYLDGGNLPGEPVSTVVDARGALRVLRHGAITAAAIETAIGAAK